MDDMRSIVNTITRVTFILMSASLFVWALAPEYRAISIGFFMGISIGLINIRYLAMKIQQVTEYIANQEKRRFSLGFVTRLCLGLLGIMVAVRFEQVSLEATIAGILLIPVMLVPVSIVHSLKRR